VNARQRWACWPTHRKLGADQIGILDELGLDRTPMQAAWARNLAAARAFQEREGHWRVPAGRRMASQGTLSGEKLAALQAAGFGPSSGRGSSARSHAAIAGATTDGTRFATYRVPAASTRERTSMDRVDTDTRRPVEAMQPDPRRGVDIAAAEAAAAAMLRALGVDLDVVDRRETPARMVGALVELLTPPAFHPTAFDNAEGYDEIVVVAGIGFHSLCEHHALPFVGTADIAYVPAKMLAGLSKLAWVVKLFARLLQVQERMTAQIADWLVEQMDPAGVGVRLRAEHLCMSLRGPRAAGSSTTTFAVRGVLRDDPDRRREWIGMLAGLP